MFGIATETGNVNDWILVSVIGFLVTTVYFVFVMIKEKREDWLKSLAVVNIAGVGFWALSGYVGWFVSNM